VTANNRLRPIVSTAIRLLNSTWLQIRKICMLRQQYQSLSLKKVRMDQLLVLPSMIDVAVFRDLGNLPGWVTTVM